MATTYLVGGSVRDKLLNLPVADRDWVVVGATPDELISLGYQQVGKDFPVFLHPITKEEYALARTERKSGNGYSGFICDFDKSITLEQDLIRRDLTINAIAMDEKGNIVDPYHGVDDLNHKILRHVSPAFREDPLRVLRVARFAARYAHLGFVVADETLELMKQITISGELSFLTAERVWKETEKALSTDNPQVYFQVLEQCGAFPVLFPSLRLSDDIISALKFSVQLSNDQTIRFGVLCARLASKSVIELLCNKIKAPNNYRQVAMMAQYAEQVKLAKHLTAEQIISLLNSIDIWRHPHRLKQLITISQAYANTMVYPQAEYLLRAYEIANNVNVQQIIAQGFIGKQIQVELNKKRIEALLDCN